MFDLFPYSLNEFRKYGLTFIIPRKIGNVTLHGAEATTELHGQIQWFIKWRSIVNMFMHKGQIEQNLHNTNDNKFALVSEV